MMSLAAHEFVHGAFGIGQHTEDFAAKLTEVTAVMLDQRQGLLPVLPVRQAAYGHEDTNKRICET